jgi:hypothetical protein
MWHVRWKVIYIQCFGGEPSQKNATCGDIALNGMNSIKTYSQEIVWGFDWIAVGQDRDRWWSCCEYGNERSDSIE